MTKSATGFWAVLALASAGLCGVGCEILVQVDANQLPLPGQDAGSDTATTDTGSADTGADTNEGGAGGDVSDDSADAGVDAGSGDAAESGATDDAAESDAANDAADELGDAALDTAVD